MVTNTSLIQLNSYDDNYGSLIAVEESDTIPFEIKRVYYIFDVEDGRRRGFHSHRQLQQALVCVHGSVKILIKTPFQEEIVTLDNPRQALLVGPMVWREMYDFTPDAVLLVFASEHYCVEDYIRNYEQYEKEAIAFFKEKEHEK